MAKIFRRLSELDKFWSFGELEKSWLWSSAYTSCLRTTIPTFPSLELITFNDLIESMPDLYEHFELEEYANLFRHDDDLAGIGWVDSELHDNVVSFFTPKLLDSIFTTCAEFPHPRSSLKFEFNYNFLPFGFLDHKNYSQWSIALQRLTSLNLTQTDSLDSEPDVWDNSNLGPFIASASNFENLCLSYGGRSDSSELFHKGLVLRHLEVLELDYPRLEKNSMFDFFDCHGPQLQKLNLSSLVLVDGDDDDDDDEMSCHWRPWISFFNRLKEISLIGLQDFIFDYTHCSSCPYDFERIEWIKKECPTRSVPTIVPPSAIQYLMCGKKTNPYIRKPDPVTHLDYDWNAMTWDTIRTDLDLLDDVGAEAWT